jgi:branched-chain amino acid transport system substrate-binding protein
MKNRSALFIFFLLSLFTFLSCSKEEPVRIGVIISSTGSGSHMSETIDGIRLAVQELNEWGGINERPIELIIRDNETNPQKAAELFTEIEKEYQPDLYITALSSISFAVAPLAQQTKVPQICLVSSNTELTSNGDYIFRFYVSAEKEMPPMMYFIENKNLNDIAVVYRDDEFGRFIWNLFKQETEAHGDITIEDYPYEPENTDVTADLENILKAEAVYIIGYATDMSEVLIQLSDAGYSGVKLAYSSASQTQVRELPAAEGVFCSAPVIYNSKYSYAAELKKNFEAKFDRPLNHYGANGYEAVKILASLMEGRDITRDEIRKQLSGGFVNTGSLGKIFVKEGSRDFDFELLPAVITNGKLEYE